MLKVTKENLINVNNILNSNLVSKLNNIENGLEKITSDIDDKITTLKTEFSEKQVQQNKKMTLLTVLIIINIIITLSAVALTF